MCSHELFSLDLIQQMHPRALLTVQNYTSRNGFEVPVCSALRLQRDAHGANSHETRCCKMYKWKCMEPVWPRVTRGVSPRKSCQAAE